MRPHPRAVPLVCVAALRLLTFAPIPVPASDATLALEWNDRLLDALRSEAIPVTLATRHLALLHLATHDAIQSIVATHQPYLSRLPAPADTPIEAAALGAAEQVLNLIHPTSRGATLALANQQRDRLDAGSNPAWEAGERLGREIANRLVESRLDDGAATQVPYIPDSTPGAWRRTPPFFRPPLDPHWRFVDLFALPTRDPFVAPPPPTLDSQDYRESLEEVRSLGSSLSTTRTPEQTLIARFWSDFAYTATPPGHWQEVVATLATERHLDLPTTARLQAMVALAQADAAIVCWEGKYRYNFWRPVTAIQQADTDGLPDSASDPGWNSLLASPHFPEHPSGHSTFSHATAAILVRFFGTGDLPFTVTSDTVPGVSRSFPGPDACAEEIGRSRIYGGIHFETGNRGGRESGHLIGSWIADRLLLPEESLPALAIERDPAGSLQVRAHVAWGTTAQVESSPDLRDWAPMATVTFQHGGTPLPVSVATPPEVAHARFYRIRRP